MVFFEDVLRDPRVHSRCRLETTAAHEQVSGLRCTGDHAVVWTTCHNIFVLDAAACRAERPVPVFQCAPRRRAWGFGALFGAAEPPVRHAAWSPKDRSLFVVRGAAVEKWRRGAPAPEFRAELPPDAQFRALCVQGPEDWHVLLSAYAPPPHVSPAEVAARAGDYHTYTVLHYRGAAVHQRRALRSQLQEGGAAAFACHAAGGPDADAALYCAIGIDNLLIVAQSRAGDEGEGEGGAAAGPGAFGREDAVEDEHRAFAAVDGLAGACHTLWASGVWEVRHPELPGADLALADLYDLTDFRPSEAAKFSKTIANTAIADPEAWERVPAAQADCGGPLLLKALGNKVTRHRGLLAALHGHGLLDKLSKADCCEVVGHGEQLFALHALRKLQNDLADGAAAHGPDARGAPPLPLRLRAFFHAALGRVVDKWAGAAGAAGAPAVMTVEEQFYSNATKCHDIVRELVGLAGDPDGLYRACADHDLPRFEAVPFINDVLEKFLMAVLGHRAGYYRLRHGGAARAMNDRECAVLATRDLGNEVWTVQCGFEDLIIKQLDWTQELLQELASLDVTAQNPYDPPLTKRRWDPGYDDVAGSLIKQQANLIRCVLALRRRDSPAHCADARDLMCRYLLPEPGAALNGNRVVRLEVLKELAEHWLAFDVLVEVCDQDQDVQQLQEYAKMYATNYGPEFHMAVCKYYQVHLLPRRASSTAVPPTMCPLCIPSCGVHGAFWFSELFFCRCHTCATS